MNGGGWGLPNVIKCVVIVGEGGVAKCDLVRYYRGGGVKNNKKLPNVFMIP